VPVVVGKEGTLEAIPLACKQLESYAAFFFCKYITKDEINLF